MKPFKRRKSDFEIQTFRSGGPGGQAQNTSDTGVRIIDKETGLRAESREHGGQEANRRAAFRKLADKLIDYYSEDEHRGRYAAGRKVIRTYSECDDRVSDHDTGDKYSFKNTIAKDNVEEIIDDRRFNMGAENNDQ